MDELSNLRVDDLDAWSFLSELIDMSKDPGGLLIGHHKSPLRVPSQHVMGELKSRGADGRQMYRMYYGEPDQQDNLAAGVSVTGKRTFSLRFATSRAQDSDIRKARDRFMKWLKARGMTSGA
ncbi:hypothetical protein [Mycolicibacterium elephantis]|uniref:Uncharacterized protein n=1 Tax=Mycolicibacterium elephantis DSM 44368 TaxID=1335622 RepID=A0A439DPQ9_9MYCO|nr:hypothetical protein [Mycolicibacterium elephantis]MCV7219851.1 hypothetical protein [Mycolicibacterium elephantis]OBA88777.1 hypothetical protein A5633_08385 [Mycolicibacterium elephantis]RWA17589.1 hypothetical protein MELE44368_05435 [Mycolicibacterium elephantis DSM 44368]